MPVATVATNGWLMWLCPGCECSHGIPTAPEDKRSWTWNGSLEKPTISPSILVRGVVPVTDEEVKRIMGGEKIEPKPLVCHSFVRDGRIEFLGDCTHKLAGQTVEMEEDD